MIQVIVTGHGNFAGGMLSALKLIAGEHEHIHGLDFVESMSTQQLKEELKKTIELAGNEILIAVDLLGGSPYNTAVTLMSELTDKKIKVIAGVNFPMVLSTAFTERSIDLDEFLKIVMEDGQKGISVFEFKKRKESVEEDGI